MAKSGKIELVRGLIQWRFRVVAGNGEVLSVSQRYFSKGNAKRAAERFADELDWPLRVVK